MRLEEMKNDYLDQLKIDRFNTAVKHAKQILLMMESVTFDTADSDTANAVAEHFSQLGLTTSTKGKAVTVSTAKKLATDGKKK